MTPGHDGMMHGVEVLFLSEADVRALIDLRELLDALEQGFADLSAGRVAGPPRNEIALPDGGFLLGMPGHRPGSDMTVKVVTVFEQNAAKAIPTHLATIALYDPETGECRAFMDGTYITAVRTAAAAAVAARMLARPDARVLTILGAGVQGEHHLAALPLVREFEEIRIGSLKRADAERLATLHPAAHAIDDFEAAARSSDVVALASHAGEPLVQPDWIRPGTHVSSIGYKPPRGELPRALAERHSLFVETRVAFEPTPVGCAELAGLDPASGTELGEVVAGTRPGRRDDAEITVYKAMGHVIEDLVAAELAYRSARAQGRGLPLSL